MIYAGIGARDTPAHVLPMMTEIAQAMDANGWQLRSGGAVGADTAFADGARLKTIFTVENAKLFRGWNEAMQIAKAFHPNWAACSPVARELHARNSMIVLGPNLDRPVDHIICYTSGSGGTAQALRVAVPYDIPVTNFSNLEVQEAYKVVPLKAAMAAHLATHNIKLVHIWQNMGRWNAMMEQPPLHHMTGVGDSPINATLDGLERMGFGGFQLRLFLLEYATGHLAKEIGRAR